MHFHLCKYALNLIINLNIRKIMQSLNLNSLSMRVRCLRKVSNLTQEEVAKRIGITLYSYRFFEEGIKKLEASVVKRLSDLFAQDLDNVDSEVVLRNEKGELTQIIVKKERKEFIYNFLVNFLKLNNAVKASFTQLIKDTASL